MIALIDALDEASFGGKAASLARCLRQGLPVPGGVALSVDVVRQTQRGDPRVVSQLHELFERDFAGRTVAVRSSAVGEDSASASFAGQHLTVLGVASGAGLLRAVVEVWASGHSESARAYRSRMGIDAPAQVAAVIQPMLDPVCAGVLFCRDPLDGSDRRVVEASWGLGESVVAGLVAPDCFVMAPDGTLLERRAGLKDIALVLGPDGGTREVEVPEDRHTSLCIDEAGLRMLSELAKRCEAVFGGPQDIEFAFVADARGAPELFLLQSRPITGRVTDPGLGAKSVL
jgi:pyruvate,water dikinase